MKGRIFHKTTQRGLVSALLGCICKCPKTGKELSSYVTENRFPSLHIHCHYGEKLTLGVINLIVLLITHL